VSGVFDHTDWHLISAALLFAGAGILFADSYGYWTAPVWLKNCTVVTIFVLSLINAWRALRSLKQERGN
jgi:hypothetical protein